MEELGISPALIRIVWLAIAFFCLLISITLIAASDNREKTWRPATALGIGLHGYFVLQIPTGAPGNTYGIIAIIFAACLGITRLRLITIRFLTASRVFTQEAIVPATYNLLEPYLPGAKKRREEERLEAEAERKYEEHRKEEAEREQASQEAAQRRREARRERYWSEHDRAEAQGDRYFYVEGKQHLTSLGQRLKREEDERQYELERRAQADRERQVVRERKTAELSRDSEESTKAPRLDITPSANVRAPKAEPSDQEDETAPASDAKRRRRRLYPKL